jgi:hypothetical protein
MSTWPAVGWVIRDRIFSSVDLPAPLRPMIPTTSPGATSKLTSLRAQMVVSEFPFRRNRPKGLRNALVIESRRVGRHSRLAPMRYNLLIPSALMIDLIYLIIRAQTGRISIQRNYLPAEANRKRRKCKTNSNYVSERALHLLEVVTGGKQKGQSDHGGNGKRGPVERPSEE